MMNDAKNALTLIFDYNEGQLTYTIVNVNNIIFVQYAYILKCKVTEVLWGHISLPQNYTEGCVVFRIWWNLHEEAEFMQL